MALPAGLDLGDGLVARENPFIFGWFFSVGREIGPGFETRASTMQLSLHALRRLLVSYVIAKPV